MNKRLKRFLETTLPLITGYGLITIALTLTFGWIGGLMSVLIFSVVDVVFINEENDKKN